MLLTKESTTEFLTFFFFKDLDKFPDKTSVLLNYTSKPCSDQRGSVGNYTYPQGADKFPSLSLQILQLIHHFWLGSILLQTSQVKHPHMWKRAFLLHCCGLPVSALNCIQKGEAKQSLPGHQWPTGFGELLGALQKNLWPQQMHF